jgi:hypothetical protein
MKILTLVILATLLVGMSVQAQVSGIPPTRQTVSSRSDAAESLRFQRWMRSVRRLAPRYGYHIGENDEDWQEWFWLYYFTEGVSPKRALAATAKYDRELRTRKKTQKPKGVRYISPLEKPVARS